MMYVDRLLLSLSLLPFSAYAVDYPTGITNCGLSSWIGKAPERAITLNQGTTEVMLALKLSDRMVGTAYLDDEIWPELAEEYAKVPVLSEGYPEVDQLMSLEPDFLYGSYSSAFATSHINYTEHLGEDCDLVVPRSNGENRTFCRQELHDLDIQTYLQEPFCEKVEHRSTEVTMDVLFDEIWDIATIFNVYDKGRVLIDSIEDDFEKAIATTLVGDVNNNPLRVLWLDSWDEETPYVGACCGAIQTILDHVGAKNVFEDLGVEERSSWKSVSWDEISAMDPDLIVLVDASWDTADEKLSNLCSHPVAQTLRAVQNRAYVTVPFSGSTLGVRVGSVAYNLAEAMVALVREDSPLPAVEFSNVSIASDSGGGFQAITRSGVKVYTRLPIVNGVDLDQVCPGSSANLEIRDVDPVTFQATSDKDNLPGWAIALTTVLGVAAVSTVAFLMVVVAREKNGKPMFQPVKENTPIA